MAEPEGIADRPAGETSYGIADARECLGVRVEEVEGGKVGRVHGVLVDSEDGSPTWLVVRLGRIGRRAAVPARYVAAVADRAWAAFPRSWIRGAAEIDPTEGLKPAEERQLLGHYGIPLEGGRAAELQGRDERRRSSVPDS